MSTIHYGTDQNHQFYFHIQWHLTNCSESRFSGMKGQYINHRSAAHRVINTCRICIRLYLQEDPPGFSRSHNFHCNMEYVLCKHSNCSFNRKQHGSEKNILLMCFTNWNQWQFSGHRGQVCLSQNSKMSFLPSLYMSAFKLLVAQLHCRHFLHWW